MHVTVREVRISSESETSYFLRVEWRGRDLGSGFLLLLTDGLNAWRGEVSEDGVREEAEELEMQTDRYIQDLQQALTGTEPSSTDYSFTLTYNPGPVTNMTLAYEKVQRDISFRLGSVLLCKIPKPVEEVRALLTHGLERGTALQNHNHLLKEENHRLKQELQHINAELQRYVSGKETLESELYSRFILVLNEKKAKIRSLQENLTHLQETREEGESSSPGKRTKKTTGQTREEEDEYEASTDEDQSQPASLEPTQGTSRSRSPLDDSLNDITDVAPCRKRRFRHLQPPDTVAKRPTLEPAQKQRRDPLPSSRAAANQDQAPQLPDVSPDAEDLFEDI